MQDRLILNLLDQVSYRITNLFNSNITFGEGKIIGFPRKLPDINRGKIIILETDGQKTTMDLHGQMTTDQYGRQRCIIKQQPVGFATHRVDIAVVKRYRPSRKHN